MRNIGAEGEAAFQARAIREGLAVCRSFEEAKDYDFIVDSGRLCSKVQVKSTDTLVGRTSYHGSSSHGSGKPRPYSAKELDLLVIHVLPEGSWFIVPIEVVAGRVRLAMPSIQRENLGPMGRWLGRWDLLHWGKWRNRPDGKPGKADLPGPKWGQGGAHRRKNWKG